MKIKIAFLLSLIILSLISYPTIISIVDNGQEISSLVDNNTEEENKNEELEKDIELELKRIENYSALEQSFLKNDPSKSTYFYTLEIPKKNTPPPEFFFSI